LLIAPGCSLQVVLPLLQQPLCGRFLVPQLMIEVAGCGEVVFQLETRVKKNLDDSARRVMITALHHCSPSSFAA
jgi:hypothetical protein